MIRSRRFFPRFAALVLLFGALRAAVAATAPSAPTITGVTPGNGVVVVAFSAPSNDGGSAVTGYTVTASPGGATATGASSPLVVGGLANDTAYTFTVTATNAVGTGAASTASATATPRLVTQQAYVKAVNTGAGDNFGHAVAMSGSTLVVGAPNEASNAVGVNGDTLNNSLNGAGAVYVFTRSGTTWTQQAYLKASNTGEQDQFGAAVAIAGETIVVGAPREASGALGVNGNQADNTTAGAGAAYVFVRSGTTWTQQAYLKASNTGADDLFGTAVAIAGDTVVVGAYQEDSNATGVNGTQSDNSAGNAGAAYVFTRIGTTWSQQAYLKASNTQAGDRFGQAIALSGDTLAIGADGEDSNATGANGTQSDNSAGSSGAVYIFTRSGADWTQQAYLKASNTQTDDAFGRAVALAGDLLVVGADGEDSAATGANGNQADNLANGSGAAYVFTRTGTTWTQQAYLKASNPDRDDRFGYAVAVSGEKIIVGAFYEASTASGINGNQADNSVLYTGAAYVFQRSGTAWTQQAYVKASNSTNATFFGTAVTLSGDTAVVGATRENSSAVLVGGNQSDTSASQSGAAYVFLVPTAPPAVTTPTSASVAATTATLGGNLVSGGGAAITERGIVYALTSANAAPRIGGTGVTKVAASGTATGVFTTAVTDLVGNRAYTFAAYATNSAGTAYSDVGTFTTPAGAPSAPTITSVVGGDGLVVVTFTPPANDNGSPITGYTVSVQNGSGPPTVTGTSSPIVVGGLNNNTGSYYFFTVAATNALGTGPASAFSDAVKPSPTAPQAYLKAGNTGAGDQFGAALALSGDTLVVGAPEEDSAATGVNGDAADNTAAGSGAVYVFTRSGTTWTQQAYLKAANPGAGDKFGAAVAVAGDTLVVGAPDEASAATAIGGDAADNTAAGAGAAYVFTRSGTTWTQQAYLKAANTRAGAQFGATVAVAGDTVVVGAAREASAATGINGDAADTTAADAGAAYVFTRNGTTWSQQAYVKASNAQAGDRFGAAVALAGETLVVGATGEASAATGIDGNQADNTAAASGAAYVFTRTGTAWTQQAYLKASNSGTNDLFGSAVAVSGDTVVVGASGEASNADAVNGNQADNAAANAGAAYVFTRAGTTWTQQAYLKADNSDAGDRFGASVAIADDSVVVGAWGEASRANGVNSVNGNNNTASGAAYRFQRAGTTWTQQAYIKATNTGDSDNFGRAVAASGLTLVVGASNEDSAATGVGGNQADNTAANAGAVYAYTFFYGPTVSAPVSPTVAATTATLGGTVASDGALRERGVVYARTATNAAPQIGGTGVTKVVATGTAVGDFTAAVTGLTASTGYSYAAYAINGVGTAYSPVANFTTTADVPSAPTAVVAVSGNGFAVVQFSAPASNGGAAITGYTVTASPGGATATGTGSPLVVGGLTNGTAYTFTVTATNSTGTGAASGASAAVTPALDNQQAYLKASNTAINAGFGGAIALSGDTLVVGSQGEGTTASNSGAVYVFTRSNAAWKQEAFLKAAVAGSGDLFGASVAISGDTLVVGAFGENTGGADSGAAYIFTRSGTTWTQQALLKASNPGANDFFGYAVGISGDTVIVGAPQEGSSATGVNGAQANESAPYAGAAYVFTRSGTTWTQQAYLKASNTGEYDQFGYAVALSGDTAVVGAWREDSPGTGVNGEQASNSLSDAGSAYIFTRSGTTWAQQAYLKASHPGAEDYFGKTVAISGDTVVVGAHQEDSAATGANGDAADNSRINAGAAYVFTRSGTAWTQQAYLKASNSGPSDNFGASVSVSGDVVAIGAWGEASGFGGFSGNQTDDSALSAGATYVWTRSGTTWTQRAYLKASAARARDQFGSAVAVSAGGTVAASSPLEPSNATGINGNPFNASVQGSGAAFVFLLPLAPSVVAPTATGVAPSTATLGGEVAADNGAAVTERGIVYAPTATNAAPRIGGTGVVKVAATGTATGTFTVNATGLASLVGYSYAAYATNAVGTGYSSVATFNTAPPPETVTVNGTELASATDLSGNLGTVTSGPVVYRGRVLSSDTSDAIQLSLPAGQTITAATATITNFSLGGGTTPMPGQIAVAGSSASFTANGNVTLTLPATITSPFTISVSSPSSQSMMPGVPPLNAPMITTFLGTADYVITLTLGAANPTVASVTVPAAGTKKLGDTLDFTVNWSAAVTVATTGGTPALGLTVGSTARAATYLSGSGTTATVFRYTVQAGDTDTDGLAVGALALNGGTIKDTAANDAVLTLAAVGATTALNVDGTVPTLSAVTLASGNANPARARTGDVVTLAFTASESVATPAVTLAGRTVTPTAAGNTWTAVTTMAAGDAEGAVPFSVAFTDLAGNAGTAVTATTNALAVVFDKTAPAVTAARLALTGATGTAGAFKAGDTVTATWNNTAAGDNNADVATVSVTFSAFGGSTVAATHNAGTWSATFALAAGTLDATNRNVSLTVRDTTGNTTLFTAATNHAVVDTQAPVVTAAKLSLSGATGTGGVFKTGDTVTATWDNTAAGDNNADIAAVAANFSAFGGSSAVAATNSAGSWTATYRIAAGSIEASNLNVSLTATDDAGNATTTTGTANATVDNVAPAAPAAPDLADASDTGASATDNITRLTAPVFTGTAAAGAVVTLYDTDGTTVLGTATATGGAWSITSAALAAGAHTLTAKAADSAGNLSAASPALTVTVDPTAPAAPVITGLADDTGASATDGVTNDTTLVVRGTAEAGATVTVSKGGNVIGTTTADGTGAWSFDYTATVLGAGDHSFTATATDVAGNTGVLSNTFLATVDTTVATPVIAAITTDSGSSATDRVTSDATLVLTGTADANTTVTVLRNGVGAIGTATAGAGGAWSFDYTGTPLSDGTYLFTATATDLAGNTSAASADFPVTIDTLAPVVASAALDAGTYGTPYSFTVAATGAATTWSATGLPAGLTLGAATGTIAGTPAVAGSFTVVVTATDLAGNAGTATFTLTIQRAAVSVSGLAATSRVYDGTKVVAVTGTPALVGVLPADAALVSLAGTPAGEFSTKVAGDEKKVGTGKFVVIRGLSLAGAAAPNYLLTEPTSTADVTAKSLTVSGLVANHKVYDSSVAATLNVSSAALVGVVSGDTVRLVTSAAAGTFPAAGVGSSLAVTVTGLALDGADSGNYQLTPPRPIADITPANVAITFGNLSHVFDGSPKATTVSLSPAVAHSVAYSVTDPTAAGSYTVLVRVTAPNYTGSANAALVIAKAAQTVAFPAPAGAPVLGSPFALAATASTGLPVTFAVASGPATVAGSALTFTAPGTVVVRATQAGNGNFEPASAERTFTVAGKLAQTIAFAPLGNRLTGDAPFALAATASSGLPVSFAVASGPASIAGNTLTLTGAAGAVVVRASQPGNAVYLAAPDVVQEFNVVGRTQHQVFFGLTQNNDTVAVDLAPDGKSGTLLCFIGATGEAFVVTFTLNADGTFDAVVTPLDTGAPVAAAGIDGRPVARAGVPRTFRGRLTDGAITGSIVELGLSFNAAVQPRTGATAALAGVYISPTVNSAVGTTTTIVGTQGQVLVLSSGTGVAGGTGTIAADGTFRVDAGGATIAGTVDAATTTVAGTITAAGRAPVVFSGLANTVARTDRLVNLSARARVAAERTLITGFVVGGPGGKRVLLRAVGPALAAFGVGGALPNPRLQLYDGAGRLVLENDDWNGADLAATAAQVGAFALAAGARDAALVATLAPGAYTVHVVGTGAEAGVGLAEIYDAGAEAATAAPRLVNLSTRGTVEAGEGVLIGGFVVTGNTPKKMLVRGVGPALAGFGVGGALADPRLAIYRGATLVAQNDDWGVPQTVGTSQAAATAAELAETAGGVGAFALVAGSRDAALLVTLAPGAYTAQVGGATAAQTGAALVEIYEVP